MPGVCPSVRSGRALISTHGTWANARAGALAYIAPQYNYPDPQLSCQTYLTASYFIFRPHLTLDTSQVGAGISAAKLRFYIVSLAAPSGVSLYVLKGAHGDIVDPSVWAAQNGYTDIGGQKLFSDLVLDAWNEITLNATGISWINSDPSEKKQYEGFDDGGNTDLLLYAPYRQCMSFTPVDAHTIKTLKLYAKKLGAGCGTVTVNIKAADANHFPTGEALASGEFDSGTLTTTYDWLAIDLGDGASLSAETEYCYELIPASGDASNQAKFYADSSGIYVRGQNAYYAGGWVAQPNYDMYFLEYSDEDVGGTRLCLRTEFDLDDVPPTMLQTTTAGFRAYDLVLDYEEAAPPMVTTNSATELSAVAATLNGTLDDDGGEACECAFEYGLDTGYGVTTPTQSKVKGETFSQVIHGLFPGTTYHFRAKATNSEGTSYGADRSFMTSPAISKAFALAREEL